ncbi:kinase-like protein [Hypoxylon fuscum]|nr:kinase-like protein [Hypoxylon fuscum]
MPLSYEQSINRQHDGTKHLVINNTFCRRVSALASLRIARLFCKYKPTGRCQPISKQLVVKTGLSVHLTEAATMAFVTKNTSIPVPHIHCSFVYKNQAYVIMEYIEGERLCNVWKALSYADRESIIAQLRRMLLELRAVPPPPGTGVESCARGSLRDPRMYRSCPRFGPFKTTEDFHSWLRGGLQLHDFPYSIKDKQDWKDFQEMVAMQDRPWSPPVFTHADLNLANILIRGNQVVSIVDWECSGWYPPYWEYTSACYLPSQAWRDTVPKFLDPYPEELKMEATRQRWWGEI